MAKIFNLRLVSRKATKVAAWFGRLTTRADALQDE
jgi:hypothetical protein